MSKEIEEREATIKGQNAMIKGLNFENKVQKYFRRIGWRPLKEDKYGKGNEIDVYDEKDGWFGNSYLLVECKDKEIVTKKDVELFMKKVKNIEEIIAKEKEWDPLGYDIEAIIAYTGKVSEDTKKLVSNFSPKIKFMEF